MKSTKKSLLLSALSLIMCVAMLLGTTYAWFTDSVTSGKNQIIAGNLDVELLHYTSDAASATTVQYKTDLFKVALWEPGVIAYENFVVSNVGNLALKYALNLNVFDKNTYNDHDLTEVIKVAVVNGGFTATGDPVADRASAQTIEGGFQTLADFQKTGNLKAKGTSGEDSDTYGVVLYWEPTDHDNDYNVNNYTGERPTSDGQPLFVEFGVTLVATQDTVEADSFDDQYDAMAEFPVIASAKIEPGKATKLTAYDKNNKLAAKAEIPADAPTLTGVNKIEMTVDDVELPEEVILEEYETALNFDVKFFSVAPNGDKTQITDFGTTIVNVDLSAQIPEGKTLTKVFHTHNNSVSEMESVSSIAAVTDGKYYFNSETKMLTVGSSVFSPFTFVMVDDKTPVATVALGGTTTSFFEEDYTDYTDKTAEGECGNAQSQALQAALDYAVLNNTSGTIAKVTICKDLTLDKYVFWVLGSEELNSAQTKYIALDLATAPSADIDLNGKKVNFVNTESQQGFIFVNCNITFDDSQGGSVLTTSPTGYVVFKYSNSKITIPNGTFKHSQGNALPFWASPSFVTEDNSVIKLMGGTYTRGTNMIGKEVTFATLEGYNFYGYIPEGYHAVDNGDGTFSVVAD